MQKEETENEKKWEKKGNARACFKTNRSSSKHAEAGAQRSEEREIIQEEAKSLEIEEKRRLAWIGSPSSVPSVILLEANLADLSFSSLLLPSG